MLVNSVPRLSEAVPHLGTNVCLFSQKNVILALLTHKSPNKLLAPVQIWGRIPGWHPNMLTIVFYEYLVIRHCIDFIEKMKS